MKKTESKAKKNLIKKQSGGIIKQAPDDNILSKVKRKLLNTPIGADFQKQYPTNQDKLSAVTAGVGLIAEGPIGWVANGVNTGIDLMNLNSGNNRVDLAGNVMSVIPAASRAKKAARVFGGKLMGVVTDIINPEEEMVKKKQAGGNSGKVLVEDGELYKDQNGRVIESNSFSHDDPMRIDEFGNIISVPKGSGGEVVDADSVVSASYDQVKTGDRKDTEKEKVMRFKPREANEMLQSTGLSWFRTHKTMSPSQLIKEAQEQTDKHASKFQKKYADDKYGKASREANLQQLASLPDAEEIYDIVFDAQELKKQHSGLSFDETVKGKHGIPKSMDGLYEYPNQPVIVPDGNITMDGIDYPVDAYDNNTGEFLDTMQPNQDYNFNTDEVLEIPKAQSGKVVLKTAPKFGYTYTFDESKVKDNMIPYTDRSGKKSLMHINEYSKLKAQKFNATPETTVPPMSAVGSNAVGIGRLNGSDITLGLDQDGIVRDPQGEGWFQQNGRYQKSPNSYVKTPWNPLNISTSPNYSDANHLPIDPDANFSYQETGSQPQTKPWNPLPTASPVSAPQDDTDNIVPQYSGNIPSASGNNASSTTSGIPQRVQGNGRLSWDTGKYTPESQNGSSYIVGQGDWLSSIAASNGVSVEDMIRANPQLPDPNKIKPGDTVNIPSKAPITGMKELETRQTRSVPGTPAIPTVEQWDADKFIGPPDYEGDHNDSVGTAVKAAGDVAGTLLGRVNRNQSTFGLRAQMAAARTVEPAYRTEVPYRTLAYQEENASPYLDEIDTAANQQLQYVNQNTSQGQAILNNIRNQSLSAKRQTVNRVNSSNLQRRLQTDNANVQLLNQSDAAQQQANYQYVTETQQNNAAQDAAKIAVGQRLDDMTDMRTRTDNQALYTSIKYPNFKYDPKTGEIRQINPDIIDPTKKPKVKAKFGKKKSS